MNLPKLCVHCKYRRLMMDEEHDCVHPHAALLNCVSGIAQCSHMRAPDGPCADAKLFVPHTPE